MTPYKQHKPNCFSLCLNSILDLPPCSVPDLTQMAIEANVQKHEDFIAFINDWLKVNHASKKISSLMLNKLTHEQIVLWHGCLPNAHEHVIVSGVSPRNSEKFHSVIGVLEKSAITLVHDPHPDNTFIVGQPYKITAVHGRTIPVWF